MTKISDHEARDESASPADPVGQEAHERARDDARGPVRGEDHPDEGHREAGALPDERQDRERHPPREAGEQHPGGDRERRSVGELPCHGAVYRADDAP